MFLSLSSSLSIKWNPFPHCWPFVSGIHRSRWFPLTKASDVKLWYILIYSLICAWINGCANNGDAGDLWRHSAHYDVAVMILLRLLLLLLVIMIVILRMLTMIIIIITIVIIIFVVMVVIIITKMVVNTSMEVIIMRLIMMAMMIIMIIMMMMRILIILTL